MSAETEAIVELLGRLVVEPRTGVLILLLLVAAVSDVRSQRIPNALVVAGAIFGLVYNGIGVSVAENYFSIPFLRENGWLISLQGMGVGFALFIPLYLLRAMGAGDVKLVSMIGAFLGPWNAAMALLAILLAGGVLSVAVMLWSGRALAAIHNIYRLALLRTLLVSAGAENIEVGAPQSVAAVPYAVAIAAGTIAYLMLKQLGIVTW